MFKFILARTTELYNAMLATPALTPLTKHFPRDAFAKRAAVLGLSTVLGQLSTLIVAPFVTRFFSPDDFGSANFFATLLTMVLPLATLRYDIAIFLPKGDRDALVLVGLGMATGGVVAALFGVSLHFGQHQFLAWGHAQSLAPYTWLLPFGLLLSGFYNILSSYSLRIKALKDVASTRLVQSTVASGAQVLAGLAHTGVVGLLLSTILSQCLGIGRLAHAPLKAWRRLAERHSWREVREIVLRYKKFPLISTGSSLINSVGLQAPSLLLAAMFGPATLGFYALTQRIARVPSQLIAKSVSDVFTSEAASLMNEDPRRCVQLYFKVVKHLALIGTGCFLLPALIAPWAFALIFGTKWREAGELFMVMALPLHIQFVVGSVSSIVVVLEKQGIQFCWDVLRLVSIGTFFAVTWNKGLPVKAVVTGFSAVLAINYIILFAIHIWLLKHPRMRSNLADAF